MTDHATDQRRGSTAAVWLVVALMLLPVLYVLSIGPAVRLFGHPGSPSERYGAAFYAPLEWLAEYCEPINDVLNWYISLWTG